MTEVSVDVGPNITSLLERLAQQIGTTADKVFPWYVQQAQIEGMTALIAILIAAFVLVPTFFVSISKIGGPKEDTYGPIAFISGVLLLFTLIGGTFEGVEAARKMMNPNYYAVKMLTRDIGRLSGR